ncbi:uncharacterized protein LOC125379170 [Haliotis rufescens]|uniref:uncharacterized protein LOC125379170 n=1 Tax=Haliotis rufescens TaxID=6454 RepID=UPI00201F57C4|nr:uncharacterized protein LOC125379170 [Haliotis rufescens]
METLDEATEDVDVSDGSVGTGEVRSRPAGDNKTGDNRSEKGDDDNAGTREQGDDAAENMTTGDDEDGVIDLALQPVLRDTVHAAMDDDVCEPSLRDVAVLTVSDVTVIVFTDANNFSIKSVYEEEDEVCTSYLEFGHFPLRLAKLETNVVAATLPWIKQIVIVEAMPRLNLLLTIPAGKEYWSIAPLTPSTFAVGCRSLSCVDVLDVGGNVLASYTKLPTLQKSIQVPFYLCRTHDGNILVSDLGSKSLLCVSAAGDGVFHYTPTKARELICSSSVTTTRSEDILIADSGRETVVQLSHSGVFVKDILTSQNGIGRVVGLFVHGGHLYVAMETYIQVFKFG